MDAGASGGVIYRGKILTLLTRQIVGPDGGEKRYEIVERPPAVAIVAVSRRDGQEPAVALVRQPRPAVGGETWEIPAGMAREGGSETLEDAARRELREEVGVESGDWSSLGQIYTSPGFTDDRITLFLADNVIRIPGAAPDPGEITSLAWAPLTEAIQRVEGAGRGDAKTTLGLLLARDQLARRARETKEGPMFSPESTIPFTAPERVKDNTAGAPDASLHVENILLQEFNYASSTAYQALEDRARMFNLYLVLVGALATGIGVVTQLGANLGGYTTGVVVALLTVMGIVGIAFFLKLIRLRQAWRESAIAMNIIKEHYIQAFAETSPVVESFFRWRMRTMPTGEKRTGISFVVCMTVAFLGSLSFGAAALMGVAAWLTPALDKIPGQNDLASAAPWIAVVFVTLLSLILHQLYFNRAFNRKREQEAMEKAVISAGLPASILESPKAKA